jgi:predicted O-methyltransferase YrrM
MKVRERTKKMVENGKGSLPPFDGISEEEGERISSYITTNAISRSLEIGCAYGVSSLYICEAIAKQPNPHHIIIDPFQKCYKNIGVQNLEDAGFSCWQLIEQLSELALPYLLQKGVKVQFALIDGYHTFDQALVDFFFLDRMLEDGGIIVFDDAQMPAIERVIRYVTRYPNYSLVDAARQNVGKSTKQRFFELLLRAFTWAVPEQNREDYFDDRWLRPAAEMPLGGRFVVLQKSGAAFCDVLGNKQNFDTNAYSAAVRRSWDWYRHF